MTVVQHNIFGEAERIPAKKKGRTVKERLEDYEGFLEKFKTKKTTDDCYTPPEIYDIIKNWVHEEVMPLDGVEIVRPFWPGGDYENYDYPENCVVLDNPPLSILAKIRRFYQERGIRYFLFGPYRTLASSVKEESDETFIITVADIVYENGAQVPTGFITNMAGSTRLWIAGSLHDRIADYYKNREKVEMPVYDYPDNVVTTARLGKIATRGIDVKWDKSSCRFIRSIASGQAMGKSLFGGGFLLSEKAAAEKAAAEKAAARKKIYFPLSEEEKKIIATLE